MDTAESWIVPLDRAAGLDQSHLGGKAYRLVSALSAGFRVPRGFCITTAAYTAFLEYNRLDRVIDVELGRKPLEDMRWEELWDAALRIRNAFSNASIPHGLETIILDAHEVFGGNARLAVRSSAPCEDAAEASFAGLHESVIDVQGRAALLDAVRLVWASLWSDAALLYRRELDLKPSGSAMAVLVQELQLDGIAGVAFGKDPRDEMREVALVEAVPGLCSDLVDGAVDPDRWTLERGSGAVIDWSSPERNTNTGSEPLLKEHDLHSLWRLLMDLEALMTEPVDMEWSGQGSSIKVLQARPITSIARQGEDDQKRRWYLTLRPAARRLKQLSRRVSQILIPELEALGREWTAQSLEELDDAALARTIRIRLSGLEKWRRIYWDDFIPFAHGVRQLGRYYNDAVKPEDAFEFTGLLEGENLLALQRNESLAVIAAKLADAPLLRERVQIARDALVATDGKALDKVLEELAELPGGASFVVALRSLLGDHMDVSYAGRRLGGQPEQIFANLLEMATASQPKAEARSVAGATRGELEERLYAAVGPQRQAEAEEVLTIGRLSWRLRDDDNVLLGRVEAQFLRALNEAGARLYTARRIKPESLAQVDERDAPKLLAALVDPQKGPVVLEARMPKGRSRRQTQSGERPRQLVGQPAAAGLATGVARIVETVEDMGRFCAGEVMICQAIEPTMTHLVPLACAIVERRGGMLIHGAIIARELGIPCVNGIAHVLDYLGDGDLVTVDGHLGIVTVGTSDFDMEAVDLPRI